MNTIKAISILALTSALMFTGCVTQKHIPVELTSVVTVAGQSKKVIYNKTRQWFSQYFVSGKSVVDYENPESGTIIGNGRANIGSDPFGIIQYLIEYNIKIDVKDNKFRVLTKITKHINDGSTVYDAGYVTKDRSDLAEKHVQTIVNNIKAYVTNKKNDNKSDW